MVNYNTVNSVDTSAIGAFFGAYMAILLVIYVLSVIAMWKVFTKAGKPGWASIIPIYNIVVLYQIIGINPWLLLLYIVPIVNYVAMIVLTIIQCGKLAKAFGKSTGFAVGLFFLNPIFMLMLAFGNSQYVGKPE